MICYQQIREAQELEDLGQFRQAANLVRDCTLNVQWYKSLILRELNTHVGATPEANAKKAELSVSEWEGIVLEKLNQMLHDVRARHFAATQEQNFHKIAETAFEEGQLYCLNGNYRQSLLLFRQARSADSSCEVRSLYLATQTHMIQKDWSMIVSSLVKYTTTHFGYDGLWKSLTACFAFASWCLSDFCNCFTTLMTLNLSQQSSQQQDEEPAMQWLSQEGLDTILVLSGMLALSPDDLKLASSSDTNLSQALDRSQALKSLLKAFQSLEITAYWTAWNETIRVVRQQWQIESSVRPVEGLLASILYGRFLAVRSQAHVSELVELFSYQTVFGEQSFDYTDLKTIAEKMDLSLEIDLVSDLVTINPKQHDLIMLEQSHVTQCAKTTFKLWSLAKLN